MVSFDETSIEPISITADVLIEFYDTLYVLPRSSQYKHITTAHTGTAVLKKIAHRRSGLYKYNNFFHEEEQEYKKTMS